MSGYLIGEVCQSLNVKPHILRYWEQQIPLLKPRKDHAGRRVYSARELQILFRLRHLIRDRKFTTEGAADKIIEELDGEGANRMAGIQLLRENLIRLSADVHRLGEALRQAAVPDSITARQVHLRALWPRLPVSRKLALMRDLELWSGDIDGAAASGRRRSGNRQSDKPPELALTPWRATPVQQLLPVSGVRPRVLLVSLCAGAAGWSESRALLQRAAEIISGADRLGFEVTGWVVALDFERQHWLRSEVERRAALLLEANRLQLIGMRGLPLLDRQGLLHVSADREGLAAYQCHLLEAGYALVNGRLRRLLDQVECVVLDQPGHRIAPRPADCTVPLQPSLKQLLGRFDPRRTDLTTIAAESSAASTAGSGPAVYRPLGALIAAPQVLIDVVESRIGVAVPYTHRVLIESAGVVDIQERELYGFRLQTLDLLTRARRPRIFLL